MQEQDALVDSIRAIIGPSDRSVSRDQILALLAQAGNDPNKAVDLFFQAHANGGLKDPAAVASAPTTTTTAAPPAVAAGTATKTPATTTTTIATEEWTPQARELSDLLGGDIAKDVILGLLRRTNYNLQKAVETYFSENENVDVDDEEEDEDADTEGADKSTTGDAVATHNELFPALEPPEIQPVTQHALEPLTPPPTPLVVAPEPALGSSSTPPSSAELESLLAPGTYEVIMVDSNFRWQIGNVFGRAVVQWVDPLGPAARAGVHKSDVLLSFRDTVVTEQNCSHIVQELSKERILVPSSMRLRRAPDAHPPSPAHLIASSAASSPPKSNSLLQSPVSKSPVKAVVEVSRGGPRSSDIAPQDDGDVEMMPAEESSDAREPRGPVDPKYGLQILCQAVESMIDAIGADNVEKKVLVDLLLLAEFNLDLAVNNLLNEHRIVSDFRQVVGQDFDPANPGRCLKSEPYMASIPSGPLGLTVENILERTIVVDIKAGGAAERAAVKRSSWLVSLNGTPITHLTHKETLRMIETATRPLELELILIPQDDYRLLRKQLSMNIRQQKTERAIPEHDRMSFRVFQLKIHQAVLVMPRLVVTCLFQHLTSEVLAPLSGPDAFDPLATAFSSLEEADSLLLEEAAAKEEETSGDMCEERKFLLNLFASIHEYDDKGEGIVIRTIQFLGWLSKRYAELQQHIDTTSTPGSADVSSVHGSRYTLLLSVVAHVLESLSIIENHATWDIMVDAFRLLIGAMTDKDVNIMIVPMVSRLSISPSPTARIVPVALLPLVFPRVQGDLRVQLRGMLDRMCNDDNPLVRRAIASIIGDLVNAGGASTASWGVQLLEKATADSHDIVRIFAVKGCIRLAQDLRRILHSSHDATIESVDQRLRLLFCQMVPMINTYTSDSSWQVRLEAAKTLPAFCLAFGVEYTDIFVDHFVGMVRDPTVEIRRTCAEGVFEIGSALIQLASARSTKGENGTADADKEEAPAPLSGGQVEAVAAELGSIEIKPEGTKISDEKNEHVVAAQSKIVRSLLPATYGLSTDLSVAVRLSLAKSVGKSLQLLSVSSYDDLVPIFTQILDDSQDANVRASLLEEMARHCDHSSQTVTTMLVPAVKALRASGQWRVRVKYVHCVGAWAEQCERSAVPLEFADSILELLGDTVSDVRFAASATLPTLARSVGPEWLVTKALPRISQCLQSTFNGRITGLTAIEAVAADLKHADKLREVIESVVEECTSKTPNLRFRALRSLAFLVPLLDDRSTTESTIEFVRPLTQHQTESDPDVRDTAAVTLVTLEASLERQQQAQTVAQ